MLQQPSRAELCRLLCIDLPENIAGLAPSVNETLFNDALNISCKYGIKAVSYSGEGYPELLSNIPDPPAILFYRGSVTPADLPFPVAVIGSRRCSLYGRKAARRIAMELSLAGACVVSGLARGIDGEAHRGALEGLAPTAAVMAGGPEIIYPPEHRSLAGKLLENGCIMSEYPPGTKPARYSFPERNRIISGLSRALIVVEAGERSGTMITVGTALEQGREVYAVPGDIDRSTTRGSNRLLRDGAGIVLSAEELILELGLKSLPANISNPSDPLLSALFRKQATPEQLSFDLKTDETSIRAKLLELELKGLVIRRPGGIYTGV